MSDKTQSTPTAVWWDTWRHPWTWGVTLLSLSLLAWVVSQANLSEVWSALRSANYSLIALSLPVFLIGLVLRAMRWRILLLPVGQPSLAACLRSMVLGYLANNLLPARAGELVKAYVLGRETRISRSAILATIVVERLVDGLVMLLAISSLLLVFPMPAWVRETVAVGAAIFIGILAALIVVRKGRERVIGLFQWLLSRLPLPWQARSVALVDNFSIGLISFRHLADAAVFSVVTISVWSADTLMFWLVLQAFHIPLTLLAVLLVIAAGTLSTTIPAMPGYVGTYEFVLVNILTLLGAVAGPATAFALGIHAITWMTINVLGLGTLMGILGSVSTNVKSPVRATSLPKGSNPR